MTRIPWHYVVMRNTEAEAIDLIHSRTVRMLASLAARRMPNRVRTAVYNRIIWRANLAVSAIVAARNI